MTPEFHATRARRRSLRRNILFIVMTATSAALLLSAIGLLTYEVYKSRETWLNDLQSQADLMAQSIEATLVFSDPASARSALGAFRLQPQIRAATVFDAGGKLFAGYRSAGSNERLTAPHPQPDGARFDGSYVEVDRPILHNMERVGTLYVLARHDVLSRALDYVWILGLASLAGLGLAALIFRRMHPVITAPIVSMADISRRIIEDRNYDLRVSARAADDEIGTLVVAFNSMLDTLRSEVEERRGAEAALRAADQRKDMFLATLAHELRNPLAPISTGLALLRRADADAVLRARMRDMMERQVRQLVRLIDDLLDVSRITRGKLDLRREPVAVAELVRQAAEAATPALQAKDQSLAIELPPTSTWVNVDQARLTQVLVNLLGNASKYTPVGGHVRLAVQAGDDGSGGSVSISVADDGIGIEPRRQQEIFEMFFQVDSSLERGAAGLGIGLTLARELVQMHAGTLTVASAGLGQGSTFTIHLSSCDAPLAPTPGAVAGPQPGPAGLDIVIADDNVDFADSFASVLRLSGHRVRVANDGAQALALMKRARPRVAFFDVGMPVLNGLDLARQVRAWPDERPLLLVAVTGWGQESDRERARAAGFDQHLTKPVDFVAAEALLATIQSAASD